jgi:prepilin-type N-terminal cleavage/methylation domain-containing protein
MKGFGDLVIGRLSDCASSGQSPNRQITKSNNGVTLLELLIAVSLLSLLSVGILTALRVGVNATGKANARLMDNRRMAGMQRILEQQIAGFVPVVANCVPEDERPSVRLPFFQGEPRSMRFVSSFSLGEGWRGFAQVLEFQVIPGEMGDGVRLVVNEHVYTGSAGAGAFCLGTALDEELGVQAPLFRPIVVGPSSFVLADRLAFCRFSYREVLPQPARERWVERWIAPRWPSAVRIEMAPIEPDAVRLRPLSLTAPIRVNAKPGEQ